MPPLEGDASGCKGINGERCMMLGAAGGGGAGGGDFTGGSLGAEESGGGLKSMSSLMSFLCMS